MNTSEENTIAPKTIITPDLIIQYDDNYGIVTELKKSFPKDKKRWNKTFKKQLKKYDDVLKGWKTEDGFIDSSDIVLLTDYRLKTIISDYIREKIGKSEISFDKNFALISFLRNTQNDPFMVFEKGFGNLSDNTLDTRFHNIHSVPLKKIVAFNTIKFYDDKPPLPYIMNILWTKIFNQYPKMEEFMESKGKKIISIEINIDDLTNKLKTQYSDYDKNDDRQPEVPKTGWIRDALDKFVELKYAKRHLNNRDNYIIRYKTIKNPIKRFTEDMYGKKEKVITDFL